MASESTVTANFDGLMLLCLDEENKLSEAKIHTTAEGHMITAHSICQFSPVFAIVIAHRLTIEIIIQHLIEHLARGLR
jgi:hypothetical protein